MQTKLFIPSKIRVGFQARSDTFTGKLAYIVYYDEKGAIRREYSWNTWRTKDLGFVEFDNDPRDGYIFNKGVQRSREWGSGRSVIRVYDPRDFEFEIDVDNLIGILMHSDVSKRDIVEKCVYAWSGGNVILLPVNSEAYQESVIYTAKQSKNLSTKDLIPGIQYHKKKSDDIVTYIGFFSIWEWKSDDGKTHVLKGKKHIFYEKCKYSSVFVWPGITTLSEAVSTEPVADYAYLVDEFFSCIESQPVKAVRIDLQELKDAIATNPTEYYTYPRVYKLLDDGNTLDVLNADNYYNRTKPYYSLNYESTPLAIIFDKSIKFKNKIYNKSIGYYSIIQTSKNVNEIKQLMESIVIGKGYGEVLTTEQYVDVMSELGYGTCKLVLANGNEVTHQIYNC